MELIAVYVLVLVFSVVVHEVAHGWTAFMLGDDTAYRAGRLTLNPLPHIDPVGSIVVPVLLAATAGIPFGWAKPVPVHVGRLRDPENDHPKVAAAGPVSNLLLALVFAIVWGVTLAVSGQPTHGSGRSLAYFLVALCYSGVVINVVLAVFNLIPLPPLDGSWIISRLLPPEPRANYENLRRFGMLPVYGFILAINLTPLGGFFHVLLGAVQSPYRALAQSLANLGS